MKNYVKGLLFLAIMCVGFMSCAKSDSRKQEDVQKFEAFKIYGEVHNHLLSYANEAFVATRSISSSNEGCDYLAELHNECIDKMDLDENAKSVLKQGIADYKDWYITDNLYEIAITQTRNLTEGTFNEDLASLYDAGLIDEFEYGKLLALCNASAANHRGELSLEEFQIIVDGFIKEWELQDYEGNSGTMLAVSLAVAQSSLEWWIENHTSETRALPAWAAADIAGALIGGISNAGYQLLVSDNDFSWSGLGWATVSGAAVGSTGAVTKVGKWLSGLF